MNGIYKTHCRQHSHLHQSTYLHTFTFTVVTEGFSATDSY